MKKMGGEKVLSIRIPYDIYCYFDKFVRENNLTKTEVVVEYLKDLVSEMAKKEMEELGVSSEREQLRASLQDLKKGDVRPTREFMKEIKEKLNIQDDE